MVNRKCKCGKSEMGFKNDPGTEFVALCCRLAGYDELGNPPEEKEVEEEGPKRAYRPSGKYSKKPIVNE